MEGIIYKITNIVNKKIYIGKTKTYYGENNLPFGINGRLHEHIKSALRGSTDCPALYNAIRKHGKENFRIKEMFKCDLDDVDNHEIEQIKIHDSTDKKIGYNITLGGGGRSVVNVSEEVRKKISSKGAKV